MLSLKVKASTTLFLYCKPNTLFFPPSLNPFFIPLSPSAMDTIQRSYRLPLSLAGAAVLIGAAWLLHSAGFLTHVTSSAIPSLDAKTMRNMQIPFVQQKDGSFLASTFAGSAVATAEGVHYRLATSNGKVEESFVRASAALPTGALAAAATVNVYKGNDPSKWQEHLPSYGQVHYAAPWSGIALDLVAHGNTVEKVFTLAPQADVSLIRFAVAGATALAVGADGTLQLTTSKGNVSFTAPVAYQEIDGARSSVEVAYDVKGMEYGFTLGAYDRSLPLVIDPTFASTYFGGNDYEDGEGDSGKMSIAFDSDGNVIVAGYTQSDDLPVTDASTLDGDYSQDIFVAKFNPDLSELQAATYIGGTYMESNAGLFVSNDDTVFMAGYTSSPDFPISGDSLYSYGGNNDAFLLTLDGDLALITGTYYGGDSTDYAQSMVARDIAGYTTVFIGGTTASLGEVGENLPLPIPDESAYAITSSGVDGEQWDGFVALFTYDDETQEFVNDAATYLDLPGSETDVKDMKYSWGSDTLYIAGTTYNCTLPGEDNCPDGGAEAFVAQLPSDLSDLSGMYVGGDEGNDYGTGLAMADDGEGTATVIYLAGDTTSDNLPVTDETELDTDSQHDIFVAKLPTDLSMIDAATYIGGYGDESKARITLDGSGALYLGGLTGYALSFIDDDAFDANRYQYEAFLAKLDTDLVVQNGSYLGGSSSDYFSDLAFNADNELYVVGTTYSSNFPLGPDAFQAAHGQDDGSADAFVSMLPSALTAVCGDGYVSFKDNGEDGYVSGEECDDGNVIDADGCDSECMLEDVTIGTCAQESTLITAGADVVASYDGACYASFGGEYAKSWSDAETSCESLGGKLVSINSLLEATALNTIDVNGWIGGTDAGEEGIFVWSDETTFWSADPQENHYEYPGRIDGVYYNWGVAEPNNYTNEEEAPLGEDCVERLESGKWNDLNCANVRSYICEIPDAVSSSSSSSQEAQPEQQSGGGRGGRGGGTSGKAAPLRGTVQNNGWYTAPTHPAATEGAGSSGGSSAGRREHLQVVGEHGEQTFKDVYTDDWFSDYVKKLVERKIFEGYKTPQGIPRGLYGPADPITMGQLAKVAALLGNH